LPLCGVATGIASIRRRNDRLHLWQKCAASEHKGNKYRNVNGSSLYFHSVESGTVLVSLARKICCRRMLSRTARYQPAIAANVPSAAARERQGGFEHARSLSGNCRKQTRKLSTYSSESAPLLFYNQWGDVVLRFVPGHVEHSFAHLNLGAHLLDLRRLLYQLRSDSLLQLSHGRLKILPLLGYCRF